MTHALVCWKCGASLAALSLPLRRLDECKSCGAELHVCRMCVDYDTSKAKSCREPIAEEVHDKAHANFCDYFKPSAAAYKPPDTAEVTRSRAGLDVLFGAPKEHGKSEAPSGEARSQLDDLFKPRK